MVYNSIRVTAFRFKDGERVRCRVLPPRASKAPSKKSAGKDSDSGSGPVELSLRKSRLEESDVEEAVKPEDSPEVGSTPKVRIKWSGER